MLSKLMDHALTGATAPTRASVVLGGSLGVALVGYLDWLTGPELAFSILYLIPIGVATWFGGGSIGAVLSLVSAMIWTFLDILDGRPYSHPLIPFWNGSVRLGIFLLFAWLAATIRNLTINLQHLVQVRTAALESQIRQRKEVERVVTQISSREQQRLGAELHDQLAGHLTGLAFLAKAISESLERRGLPEAPEARKVVDFLNQAIKQLRAFCRLLAPVETGSLEPGLSRLGAEIETAFGITCIVQTPKDPPDIGLDRARLLYSIAQEAVRRAVEKRMARHVEISLLQEQTNLKLVISDDGSPPEPPASPEEQELGIRIMRYRAETLGGQVQVERSVAGGSLISCVVPLEHIPASNLELLPT